MKLEENTHFFRMLIGMFGSIINDVMVIRLVANEITIH